MSIDLILGLVVGGAIGFGLSLFIKKGGSDEAKIKELEAEHQQYRKQVDDHFVNTAVLFKGLTDQYRDVYRHIATGAGELCSEDAKAIQVDLEETALLASPNEAVDVAEANEAVDVAEANEAIDVAEANEPTNAKCHEINDSDDPLVSDRGVPDDMVEESKNQAEAKK